MLGKQRFLRFIGGWRTSPNQYFFGFSIGFGFWCILVFGWGHKERPNASAKK